MFVHVLQPPCRSSWLLRIARTFLTSPEEWLPQQHLTYFVSDVTFDVTVRSLFGDGRRNSPYDPAWC